MPSELFVARVRSMLCRRTKRRWREWWGTHRLVVGVLRAGLWHVKCHGRARLAGGHQRQGGRGNTAWLLQVFEEYIQDTTDAAHGHQTVELDATNGVAGSWEGVVIMGEICGKKGC